MNRWLGGLKWLLNQEAEHRPPLNQCFDELKNDESVDRQEIEKRINNVQAMFNGLFDSLLEQAQPLINPCRAEFKEAMGSFEEALTAVVEAKLLGLDKNSVLQRQAEQKLSECRLAVFDMVFYGKEKEE